MTKKDLRRYRISMITVYHNLPDLPGKSIEEAFHQWQSRTKCLNSLSFVNYIDTLDLGYEAFTQEQYDKLPN